MSYYALKFNPEGNAGNDVVTLGTALVPGIGVGTSNWAIEFRIKLDTLPASGNWYILGSNNTSTNAGFVIRAASGSGVLAIVSAGTHIPAADSPTGYLLADGEFHTYRIVRVAGTSISFYRDGATIQLNKAWATASNFALSLNRFGRGSVSGTGGVTPMELEWFDATEFDTTNGRRWVSDLSGGVGTIWPTTAGTNQGTLANFDVPTCWIFYSTSEDHFGTFATGFGFAYSNSGSKTAGSALSGNLYTSTNWSTSHNALAGFSTTYNISRQLVTGKEIAVAKPDQALQLSRTLSTGKDALVNKPTQNLNVVTSNITTNKNTLAEKPIQTLNIDRTLSLSKEVSSTKPNTTLEYSFGNLTWEIFYGVGGSFASYMGILAGVLAQKDALNGIAASMFTTGTSVGRKEGAGTFSGQAVMSSEATARKEALSQIYVSMVEAFNIGSSSKFSGSQFSSSYSIIDNFNGGADLGSRPRIITYSTNAITVFKHGQSVQSVRIV